MIRVRSGELTLAVEVSGQGVPVVYLHGLGGCRQYARIQWGEAGQDVRLIVFDQRGHGQSSPARDEALYQPRLMGEDIAAVLDALEIPRAIVGGAAMGAAAALRFAQAHPERTLALLQTGPAFGDRPNRNRAALQTFARLLEEQGIEGTIARTSAEWQALNMPEEATAEMAFLYRHYDAASMIAAHRAVSNWRLPLSPLRELSVPVFLLAWRGDPQHDPAIAMRMKRLLPRAWLQMIPGVFSPNLGATYRAMMAAVLDVLTAGEG